MQQSDIRKIEITDKTQEVKTHYFEVKPLK